MSGPAMAEMLDLLCKLGKEQQAGVYLVTNSASKVMDIPS